ncbi:triphosphoribosyl-dephospho-CoA synthase [Salmonella enterica]|uniref:triphosphoribosyl-dephospho-CoA synthase n=1 Tax=Salmonella enterica TaxID=28901 RepID=UPI001E3EBF59|nr:triphosphoribosyl-dephospho-CoA synthase [Salmonella enterica]
MNVSVVTERRTPAYSSLAAGELNGLVARALLTEARLTPKPGLVDIRNSGAHRDMDLAAFERSTTAIAPWMEKFFIMGNNTAALAAENVLVMLRPLGMACENDMLQATNGVNTHRGAIFAFGLSGARGEAESGFRTVRTQALPVFNRVVQEHDDTHLALLQTLLHLMAWNDDTNLVSRGGLEGLYYVQQQAQKLLWQGGVLVEGGIEAMQSLDDELILRNLSPGGSADLLAVTWFLSHFPAGSLYPE